MVNKVIVVASSQLYAEQELRQQGINPKDRNVILAIPSRIHKLRGFKITSSDLVIEGYSDPLCWREMNEIGATIKMLRSNNAA